jgi:hypothetical protein
LFLDALDALDAAQIAGLRVWQQQETQCVREDIGCANLTLCIKSV